jgi:hypothetical protein
MISRFRATDRLADFIQAALRDNGVATMRTARRCLVVGVSFAVYMVVTSIYPLSAFNPIWLLVRHSGYESAIRNGPSEIAPVSEFVQLFPDASHLITHYTGDMGAPQWTSKIGLHGRYVLSVQLDIKFDWSRRHVCSYGPPEYHLREVESVEPQIDGTTHVRYVTSGQRDFGSDEWQLLYRAGGDLSSLGLEVIKDKPVSHFVRVLSH